MVEKPTIDIAFVGHVDHGKSTLVGRLLLDTGQVEPHVIEKYKKEAEEKGKSTFELAWVMDDLKEERERGVTIRSQIRKFETSKYHFNISDAPGHQDFIANMIRGTRQAEAAILVVDVNKGVQPQTKEHLTLAKTFGIDQIIVAINKMDATNPPYSSEHYEQVKGEVESFLEKIPYKTGLYSFVPVSAYKGDNISNPSKNLPWYSGRTLVDLLNNLQPREKPVNLPLRWSLRDIMKIPRVGWIPVGYIETGKMKEGDQLIFMPANKEGTVRSIEIHGNSVKEAVAGDPVGADFRLIGKWEKQKELRSGYVAGLASDPPTVAETFTARVIVLESPGIYIDRGSKKRFAPMIHCHEAKIKCGVIELEEKLDSKTLEVVEKLPSYLGKREIGIVKFKPYFPFVIEEAKKFPNLGRFAIRDQNKTIGAGEVLEVEPKIYEKKRSTSG